MRTVKELSELTGISVRTLHYYDEIGLFKPTAITAAGYRLYDEKAVERLQEILVFRELALPLADIKHIMEDPEHDRGAILAKQREMLCLKKERLERIIASLDNLLKGGPEMDYTVFDEIQLREMIADMLQNMNETQKKIFIDRYGSMDAWEKHMIEGASDEHTRKNYAKVVEWYGSREAVTETVKNPLRSEIFTAYQERIGKICKKLAEMKDQDVNSFEVRQLIGEYAFVAGQLYQMGDPQKLLLDIAAGYQENEERIRGIDSVYREGAAYYIGSAVKAFYSKK